MITTTALFAFVTWVSPGLVATPPDAPLVLAEAGKTVYAGAP